MKAKAILYLLFLGFFLTSMNAYERSPKAISPGSEEGIAIIAQSCPTFSWTAVDWAEGYRVTVFEVVTAGLLPYEEMEAVASPVFSKEIRGRASSWTPSSDERLVVGREYVWYVHAFDVYGQGVWSEGRVFKVDLDLRFDGVEGNVRKKLEEQGLSDEVIEDVLKDIKSGVKDVIAYGVDTKGSSSSAQERMSIQDLEGEEENNTFFGLNAGLSLTSGHGNTLIGNYAGFRNTSGSYNTFIGSGTGANIMTTSHNTFLGHHAGQSNITGEWNTFISYCAGQLNSGSYNTFIGPNAGSGNSGSYNIFIGESAGDMNSGSYNTFLGYEAGKLNTTGNANTFIGSAAGEQNTEGYSNLFMGYAAGHKNTTGYQNTFLGRNAGYNNTTGPNNTFIGFSAGLYNTSGYWNTFLGPDAGLSNTTGHQNTFLGYESGHNNTSGNSNTFIGLSAGHNNTTGTQNVYLGHWAGHDNITGSGNVFLGNNAGYFETGSRKLYIDSTITSSPLIWGDFSSDIVAINGQFGVGTQSPGYPMELERTGTNASIVVDRTDGAMNYINATASYANFGSVRSHPLRLVVNSLWKLRLDSDGSLTMSNGATCTAGGEWQNASSRELKENIRDLTTEEAEEALEGLVPVRFNYKADKEDESVGFIAEDVPELVATKGRKGMSTMDVAAVLTKVVQEQQRTVQEQQRIVKEQQETISELKNRIAKLEKR